MVGLSSEMSLIYKSERIGKGGKPFTMYKIRTLKENKKTHYNHGNNYTFMGKFLRKYRLDEAPQLLNVLKGDMSIVGPRPQEAKTIDLYPDYIKDKLLSVKPGMFGLAGIHFMDEEHILTLSEEPEKDYWERIAPLKITLDFFYIENKCLSLDLWIAWQAVKKRLWNF